MLTREEAKQLILNASKNDTSSPINCIHLLTLHKFLEKIYDEHEAQMKAKDERIKELEEAMKPKTCDGCKHRSHLNENLTNKITNGFCVENGFFTKHGFCCNKHEPKDNA